MSRSKLALATVLVATGLSAYQVGNAGEQMKMAASKPAAVPSEADKKLIHSAMQAAPAKVSEKATIVEARPDGSMRTVRAGSNGFTCMADNPETPGPDPMCMDAAAWAWAGAWMGHKTPAPGKVGFMYMLSGGTDASNTDPYATAPTEANNWIKTGPHVMVLNAMDKMKGYPASPNPDTSVPYVMWAGTPYAHLMLPVQ